MEKVALRAWGNSQGIRIPKEILNQLDMHVSDVLQLDIKDDALIIKKAFVHKTFEDRLAEYNGEISLCDFDFGKPQGRELL